MKIKLDENIPASLVDVLSKRGHDADTVAHEDLRGRDDTTIWQAAQHEGRFLTTQDLDFSDIRRFLPGTHHGLLLLRLPGAGRAAIANRVQALLDAYAVEQWRGCLVVVTKRKIRIRRPEPSSDTP